MKKLLHERLREYDYYNSLADEIEKYYIPRPRFEDGEPVQFGYEYRWADGNIRKITGFGETENGAPYITCAFDGKGMSDAMIYSGSLYRPEPKVLDADGVEIKVGDTVWHVNGSHPWEVCEITDHGIEIEDKLSVADGCCVFEPSSLTHREPDSLRNLYHDMAQDETVKDEYIDRLAAIMERDA